MTESESLEIAVSCIELSGDSHLATLVETMREQTPRDQELDFFGLGAGECREAGVEIIRDVSDFAAIGFFDNLMRVPTMAKARWDLLREIDRREPDALILVDGRVFNLGLAGSLRKRGYSGKIIYYISPVRWESLYRDDVGDDGRFRETKEYCDLALLAYPVSLEHYRELDMPHEFIGHPLLSKIEDVDTSGAEFRADLELPEDEDLLLLLPGSRRRELELITPPLLEGAKRVTAEKDGVTPLSVAAAGELQGIIDATAKDVGLEDLHILPRERFIEAMIHADAAGITSGSALHAALLTLTPCLMAYRVASWQAWIARHLLGFEMPHYGFINLIAGEEVVREFIQEDCTGEELATELSSLLQTGDYRKNMVERMGEVRRKVVREHPVERAAELIFHQLYGESGYKEVGSPRETADTEQEI